MILTNVIADTVDFKKKKYMEHLDEILERLMNKPKDKQTNIFDQIEEQKQNKL